MDSDRPRLYDSVVMSDSDDTRRDATATASLCPTCGGALDASGVCPNCATSVRAASATLPEIDVPHELPDIPGYRVLSNIGEGGMGAVFLAEDLTLGRRVAIKMVSARVAEDAQLRSRFGREARTLATIEHPHVVRVYTFGESAGSPYIVMEFVEGDTLTHRLARDGKFDVAEALRITRQVAKALAAAWQRRVIHRDIKPSNVLLDRENEVRVVDFGLAKPMHLEGGVSDASLTQSGYMLGTPHYISPEQAQGKDVDFRSDIYSLGIMLYHMIAGERPFDGTTPIAIIAKHLQQPVPTLGRRIDGATQAVDNLLAWMTAKDPAARPQSYEELIGAIDNLRSPTPATPAPTYSTVAVQVPPAQSRTATIFAILLVVVAIGVIAARMGLFRRNPSQAPAQTAATALFSSDGRFVVAVAPFYGPDSDSEKEGRVMAALIEQSVIQRLGADKARVLGIDKTKEAVRDHDAARALGGKLGAHAVIWGEAFALRQETEIQPHVTMVRQKEEATGKTPANQERDRASAMDAVLEDRGGGSVKLQAEAPNQIEMRKTSASGIGDLVVFVAGIHALEAGDAASALEYFHQSPPSPESMRFQADALIQLERNDEAREILEKAVAADPKHVASRALLGDLQVDAKDFAAAASSYAAADALGQPYTTTRGFFSDGVLYTRDTYRSLYYSEGKVTATLYLLGIEPSSGRVVSRELLSGVPTRFERSGESTAITLNTRFDDDPLLVVRHFARGHLDRPAWPGSNFLFRMRTMKSGKVIAANFVQHGLDGVREFGEPLDARLTTEGANKLDPQLPSTLPDLERALRAEAQRDPTQPWFPFLLSLTLRAQNRAPEGDALFEQVLSRRWTVAYWEFSWMAAMCERLRLQPWSSRFAEKAIEQRKAVPSPAKVSWLIDRMISAPFVRHAALNLEGVDGYRALQQARSLMGFTPEGDDIASIAWAGWFEKQGRPADARREREYAARVRNSPLNSMRLASHIDMSGAFFFGALLALFYAVTATLLLAIFRARRADVGPGAMQPARLSRLAAILNSTARLAAKLNPTARLAILTAAICVCAVLAVYAWVTGWIGPAVLATTAGLVVLAFTFGKMKGADRFAPRKLLLHIDKQERFAVAICYCLMIASGVVLLSFGTKALSIAQSPVGMADSLGNPRTLYDLQDLLKKYPDTHALQYVTAVAAHYGGETEAAASLYRSAGGAKAAENLRALEAHQLPAVPLTDADWAAAMSGSWISRLKTLRHASGVFGIPETVNALIGSILAAATLLVAAVLFGRGGRRSPEATPESKIIRAVMLVVPGLWDACCGSLMRAAFIVFGIASCIPPLFFGLKAELFVLGPISLSGVPNLLTAYPFPDAQRGLRPLMLQAALADPHVIVFLTIIALLGVTAIVLHVSRIPRILRSSAAS